MVALLGVGGTQGAIITGTANKFNRQLHPTEMDFLEDEERLERYRQHVADVDDREISLEEAERELKVAALYMVSQSWEDNLDITAEFAAMTFLDAESQGLSYTASNGRTAFYRYFPTDRIKQLRNEHIADIQA